MTRFSHAPLSALAAVAALVLATGGVRAQGTDAQREACTPDALKLCQATIPDIEKTTVCMRAHFTQLSPRCKVAFNDVAGGTKSKSNRSHREAVSPPPAADEDTDVVVDAPVVTPGMESYAAQIRGYCRQGLIDPFTCRNTLAALRAE